MVFCFILEFFRVNDARYIQFIKKKLYWNAFGILSSSLQLVIM